MTKEHPANSPSREAAPASGGPATPQSLPHETVSFVFGEPRFSTSFLVELYGN
jgi:hypothetical protein